MTGFYTCGGCGLPYTSSSENGPERAICPRCNPGKTLNTPVDEFEEARAKHLALASAGNDHHFIVFLIDAIRKLREPGWHSSAGNVVISMTRDDYDAVLLLLGGGSDALHHNHVVPLRQSLALMNRLNAGNPDYTMYRVEAKKARRG